MGRGKGWREEEDHLLCRAYAIAWRECRSKSRTQEGFWQEALAAYLRRAPSDFVQRTPEGLRKRWAKIRTHVVKYRDAVRKANEEGLAPQGSAEMDKIINQNYINSLKGDQRGVGKFRFMWCYEYFKGSREKLLKVVIGRPKESRRPDEPDYESESDVELDEEDQVMLEQHQNAQSNTLSAAPSTAAAAPGPDGAVPPPPPPPPLGHDSGEGATGAAGAAPTWNANGSSSGATPVAEVIAMNTGSMRSRMRAGSNLASPSAKRQKTATDDAGTIKVTLQEVVNYLRTPEPPKGDHRHPLWKDTGVQLQEAIALSQMEILLGDLLDFNTWKRSRDPSASSTAATSTSAPKHDGDLDADDEAAAAHARAEAGAASSSAATGGESIADAAPAAAGAAALSSEANETAETGAPHEDTHKDVANAALEEGDDREDAKMHDAEANQDGISGESGKEGTAVVVDADDGASATNENAASNVGNDADLAAADDANEELQTADA